MTREAKLERTLRALAVVYRLDNHFHCDLCGGKWTLAESKGGHERHTRKCVLKRSKDHFAEEPPPIPF